MAASSASVTGAEPNGLLVAGLTIVDGLVGVAGVAGVVAGVAISILGSLNFLISPVI